MQTLYRRDVLRWDALTTLAQGMGMWHMMQTGLRDDATLGDRLDACQARADADQRRSVFDVAMLVSYGF